MILGICIGVIFLGILIFVIYMKRMLNGRCCEGCDGCSQRGNCSNYKPIKINKKRYINEIKEGRKEDDI